MKTRASTLLLLLLLSLFSTSIKTGSPNPARAASTTNHLKSPPSETKETNTPETPKQHPLMTKAKKASKSRMKRALYMEKLANPDYNELFAGKGGIDHEYMRLIDDQKSMEEKMNKEQAGLYKEYRRFEGRKADMRKKRDAKLSKVLQAATMDNFFTTDPEQYVAGGDSVEISAGGLSLDGSTERRAERLMGMKDLGDLKHLDIDKEISKRIKRVGKPEQSEEKPKFNAPRERELSLQAKKTKAKRVKVTAHPSFLVRNGNPKSKSGRSIFKPEKRLFRDTEHRLRNSSFFSDHSKSTAPKARKLMLGSRRKRGRRSKRKSSRKLYSSNTKINVPVISGQPAAPGPKPDNIRAREREILKRMKERKKRKKKTKALKKKFKKEYKYNWVTMKWFNRTKFQFQLVDSIKDLPFWRQMGFKIKKSKLLINGAFDLYRPHKESQMQCMLLAKFGKLTIFNLIKKMFFKISFRSNCAPYEIVKVFQGPNVDKQTFRITIGKYSFTLTYNKFWQETKGEYRLKRPYFYIWVTDRKYSHLKVFPTFLTRTYDPWRNKLSFIRTGLVPRSAVKWKGYKLFFFKKYQWAYPLRTYKQGQEVLKGIRHRRLMRKLNHQKMIMRLSQLRKERARKARERRYRIAQRARNRRYRNSRRNRYGRRSRYTRSTRSRYGRSSRSRSSRYGRSSRSRSSRYGRSSRSRSSRYGSRYLKKSKKKDKKGKKSKKSKSKTAEQRILKLKPGKYQMNKDDKKSIVKSSDFAKENTPTQIERAVTLSKSRPQDRKLSSSNKQTQSPEVYQMQLEPQPLIERKLSSSSKPNQKSDTTKTQNSQSLTTSTDKPEKVRTLWWRRKRRSRHRRRQWWQPKPRWRLVYRWDKISKYYWNRQGRRIRINRYFKPKIYKNPYQLSMGGFVHYSKLGYKLLPTSASKPWVGADVIKALWESSGRPGTCKPGQYYSCKV